MNEQCKPKLWTEATGTITINHTLFTFFKSPLSFSQNYIWVQCLVHHFHWGNPVFILLLKPGFLAFTSSSISGVITWVAGTFRMSSRRLCVSLECRICFIYIHYRENQLTKIHGSKHVQNFSSKRCQVRVVWQKILIKCVQASCGKFALQIQVTLQVYYFKLNVGRHVRGIHGEWRAKHFEVFLQFIKNLKALLKLPQQSRYFSFEPLHMCSVLSGAHIFQTRQVSSATTRELHLPQWQLQLERTYAVIILRDNLVSPFKHFAQVIYVLCNIDQESKVLHPLCGLKHWFAFSFHELFDFFS